MARARDAWASLPQRARNALASSWSLGVPAYASALHGRWWQLETWLRSLAYVELRAKFGADWTQQIPSKALSYARTEARLAYMPSPDAELLLAYLDIFHLFDIIQAQWTIFEPSLLDKEVWLGRTKELRQIRHRIAHCRRPHSDDLSRIEQCMRDLEQGAFKALTYFNAQTSPSRNLHDPVVDAWVRGSHVDARRLLRHAESQYEVYFNLTFSRRPWAEEYEEGEPVSGKPGYLWHAKFVLHGDGFEVPNLWNDHYLSRAAVKDYIVYLCTQSPGGVNISFAAVDDPVGVSDSIGACFDSVLNASRLGWQAGKLAEGFDKWAERAKNLDPRVQVSTPWASVDASMAPITLFETGGGTGM